MKRHVLSLWNDTRGASVIETALIVPILTLLACGGADVGLGFAQKTSVQQSADRAVQFALNIGFTTPTLSSDDVKRLIYNEAAATVGIAPLTGSGYSPPATPLGQTPPLTVNTWLECNKVAQASVIGTCASGAPARYVSVTVNKSYQPLFTQLFSPSPVPLQGFAEGRIQ